jgi:hypothetical protein
MTDQTDADPQHRQAHEGDRESTPDSATWDVQEDTEIELLGDDESVDVVDVVDESWAPGEPPPGVPGDEVLHVHPLTGRELPADELEVNDVAQDRLAVAPDEIVEDEEVE